MSKELAESAIVEKMTYECPICGTGYRTREEATRCAARGREKEIVEVGDIVLASAGFGWFDGSKDWIKNPNVERNPAHGNCFGACCTFQFYYVVTKIDYDEEDLHRIRYHLVTGAMSGEQGYRSGYTFNEGHVRPKKVKDPPAKILKDSNALIGQKAEYLLHS